MWLMSSQAQPRPQLLLGSKLLMLVQHPLGCALLLRTLQWLRQLQVCMTPPALPTKCILRYVYGEPVSPLLDIAFPACGRLVTVVHPAMLMLPACLCRCQ